MRELAGLSSTPSDNLIILQAVDTLKLIFQTEVLVILHAAETSYCDETREQNRVALIGSQAAIQAI